MHTPSRGRARLPFAALVFTLLLVPFPALGAITPSPPAVTIAAGQTSTTISLAVSYTPPGAGLPPNATIVFTGLPPGVSTNPNPILIPLSTGVGNATVPFQLVSSAATPGGSYAVTMTMSPDLGAGVGILTLVVQSPTFDAAISPVPLTLTWGSSGPVTIATIVGGGFASVVTYAFSGFPAGISTGSPQVVGPPYPQATFNFSVAPRTAPGPYSGMLVATWTAASPQTRAFPMTVVVQPPTLSAAFIPSTLSVIDGGPSAQTTLSLTPGAGYSGTPSLTWGPLPAGFEVSPASLSAAPLPPARSIPVTVRAIGSGTGTKTVTVRVLDASAGIDTTAALVVNVSPAYDAALSVTPSSLTLVAGGTATATVQASGLNGFTGTLTVNSPALPSLSFSPASFPLRAGESKVVSIQASPTATTGSLSGMFVATASEISGPRTAGILISVTPQPPEITSVTPPALTAGTIGTTMRLTGVNFRPGATVTLSPAGPIVTSTIIRSSSAAEIVVTTPARTRTGSYRVDLRNPDGGSTTHGTKVIVCPASSLGAPLGVPTAAIVYPRPYTAVAGGESIRPRAVLATTGMGTVIGTWRLDGIPFEQFAIAVSGGLPVEVEAKMPIPLSSAGEHRLELVIEQPQRLTTEPVPVILTIEGNSRLRILAPDEAIASGSNRPLIRWSLVPGASGYEVEIDPETSAWPVRIRLSTSEWRPDDQVIVAIGPGRHRYRVAAVFPGAVRGEPTPWRTLTVTGPASAQLELVEPARRRATPRFFRNSELVRFNFDDLLVVDQEQSVQSDSSEADDRIASWDVTILGAASRTDEENHFWGDAARLQFTGQGEIRDAAFAFKGTGDISGRKDLDPDYSTASESRAWQVELGAVQSEFREDLRAGYSPPDFLDQSEFLSAGLARGGVLGRVSTPVGAFSYYETFFDDAAGAASAYGLTQRISGAGWEAPFEPGETLLRIFGLRARSPADTTSSSNAEALGIFVQKTFSPSLNLLVEGAWGSLDETTGSIEESRDGYGLHIGVNGATGTISYAVNFRSIDAGLVNPANLGLTAGAVPDRIGGDLTIGRSFGSKTLSLQLRRLESGSLPDGGGAAIAEESGSLTLTSPLGRTASYTASSTLLTTRGDGDPDHFLPGTDRTMMIVSVSFFETMKGLSLGQSISWQDLTDDVSPAFDQTVTAGSFTFAGNIGSAVSVSAMLSGTRSESAPPFGVTDMWMTSLQPTFRWAGPGLSVTPAASFTRVDSELGSTSDTEQYQLILQWSPTWWNSLINVQTSADWFRTSNEGVPAPSFQQRIVTNVILRWGRSRVSSTPVSHPVTLVPSDDVVRLAMSQGRYGQP